MSSEAARDDIVLETPRLLLRRFADCDADAELAFELDSDPEVMRYIGPFGLPSVEAYRERIRTVWLPYYAHPLRGFFAVIEKATGLFAGWFVLRRATDHRYAAEAGWTCASDIEIGYRLRRDAWGRGIASEVALELVRRLLDDPAVTSVVAMALSTNRGSVRVLEKAGLSRVREFALPASAGFAEPCNVFARQR